MASIRLGDVLDAWGSMRTEARRRGMSPLEFMQRFGNRNFVDTKDAPRSLHEGFDIANEQIPIHTIALDGDGKVMLNVTDLGSVSKSKLDEAYSQRAIAVAVACAAAMSSPSFMVYRQSDDEKQMWAVYIDTPTGQFSWHIDDKDMMMFEHIKIVDDKKLVWDGTFFGRCKAKAKELVDYVRNI
ncbi:hypothetical protein VPHK225_0038 [Vibrio phage K225]|nr:hypothetical protein PODOV044v1_p0036 [Vibrio phage 23E28.1]QZI92054.1 hypothetical protein PODOV045v1_p0012 [Vibrio phage 69E27.1]